MKLARRQKGDAKTLTPFNELNRIRNEIGHFLEDPFAMISPGTSFFEGWEPTVDVFEDKDKITMRAELPGMKKEDINLSLEGNTLSISGERKEEEEHKEGE